MKRFWEKVNKIGAAHPTLGTPCWVWTASCDDSGYGQIRLLRRNCRAHRVSWEMHRGAIPDGLFVLHHCDNPPCVNPAHLFLGTKADNNGREKTALGDAVFVIVERLRKYLKGGKQFSALKRTQRSVQMRIDKYRTENFA